MTLKISDAFEVYVHPKNSGQIVGPLSYDELMEFIIEETDTVDDVTSALDRGAETPFLPLFDREPEEQKDSGTSTETADRTSTYGGL